MLTIKLFENKIRTHVGTSTVTFWAAKFGEGCEIICFWGSWTLFELHQQCRLAFCFLRRSFFHNVFTIHKTQTVRMTPKMSRKTIKSTSMLASCAACKWNFATSCDKFWALFQKVSEFLGPVGRTWPKNGSEAWPNRTGRALNCQFFGRQMEKMRRPRPWTR